MEEDQVFWTAIILFSNIYNNYLSNMGELKLDLYTLKEVVQHSLPKVYMHLININSSLEIIFGQYFLDGFSSIANLELYFRILDI